MGMEIQMVMVLTLSSDFILLRLRGISLVTKNVHLKSLLNLQKFSGIVQNLDVIAVTETWFEVNSSKNIMGKVFNDVEFSWFGKERLHQTSSIGSGGVPHQNHHHQHP